MAIAVCRKHRAGGDCCFVVSNWSGNLVEFVIPTFDRCLCDYGNAIAAKRNTKLLLQPRRQQSGETRPNVQECSEAPAGICPLDSHLLHAVLFFRETGRLPVSICRLSALRI